MEVVYRLKTSGFLPVDLIGLQGFAPEFLMARKVDCICYRKAPIHVAYIIGITSPDKDIDSGLDNFRQVWEGRAGN
jgi:hypothetical protein